MCVRVCVSTGHVNLLSRVKEAENLILEENSALFQELLLNLSLLENSRHERGIMKGYFPCSVTFPCFCRMVFPFHSQTVDLTERIYWLKAKR